MGDETKESLEKKKKELTGIFGFGLSNNIYLDILNIVILAFTGIIIKIFFQENFSKDGTVGPASTTIWGYGLTCIALIILIFISFYLIKRPGILEEQEKKISVFEYLKMTIRDVLPIFLTLFIIFYIILLNFIFFNRINSNRVTDSYHSYSFISTILIIIQLILIVKYIYVDLEKQDIELSEKDLTTVLSKNATYILSTINFVFIVILHILLAFFSTDG